MSTSINSGHGRCARLARWLVGASVVTGVLWLVLRSPHLELHTQLVPAPAPVCDDTSTPPRFAMISLVGPAFLSSWRLALQAKTRYAARHGYQHLVEVPRPGSFAEIMWQKPATIARYLPYYDWVFFVDADSYITNTSLPLTRLVTPDAHVVVGDEDGPPLLAGLILVRNSSQGHAFMDRWWRQLHRRAGEGWLDYDNGAFIQTVLETVAPHAKVDTERCLALAANADYRAFSACAQQVLDMHAGPFGQRRNGVVHFLPPALTVGRFCEKDMVERAKAEVYVPQVRAYRVYHPGDFLVHCKMEPPTSATTPWMQLIDKQLQR